MKATLILVGRTNNELFAHAIADYVDALDTTFHLK